MVSTNTERGRRHPADMGTLGGQGPFVGARDLPARSPITSRYLAEHLPRPVGFS